MGAFLQVLHQGKALLLLAAGLAVLQSSIVFAQPEPPYSIQAVAGGGQLSTRNSIYSSPLVARVTDAQGVPAPGIDVHFKAPHCHFDGTFCFLSGVYPYFPSHALDVVVTADADGLATSPLVHTGDPSQIGEGTASFEFEASIRNEVPTGFSIESAYFTTILSSVLHPILITSGFTGSWYNPEQNGHGLTIEVLSGNRILVNWNAYTPDGTQQAWFGGVGDIIGNQAIVQATLAQGGRWTDDFYGSSISISPWGTLTLVFSDCIHGTVFYAGNGGNRPPWYAGKLELTRLTLPEGLSCP